MKIVKMITLFSLCSILSGFSYIKGLKKIILDNNLEVYIKEDNKLPIVSIQLWVRAGSLDETEKNNGVAHFLEHMLFKGTKNYSVGDISHFIESNGGIINAGTSKEFTQYYIDIPVSGFETGLKIIADIAQRASFPEDEFEREKNVILEEIKRIDDNPENILFENFNSQLFTTTPYKFRIIGTTQTISNMVKQDLIDFYKKLYVANNMYIVIVGDIKYKNVKKIIKEFFSYITKGEKNQRKNLKEPIRPPFIKEIKKNVGHTYILSGFLGPDINSKYRFTADILTTILGVGLSSRLNQILREEKQLVFAIESGFYPQQEQGIFNILSICETEKKDSVLKEIDNQIIKILNEKIDEKEIQKAKEIILSQWFFGQQTVNQQASVIGYNICMNSLKLVKNYIKNINRINYQDIKKFIEIYYTGLTSSILNPE